MSNLPISSNPNSLAPTTISPEGLALVDAYIENNYNLNKLPAVLGITMEDCVELYNKPEVKAFISTIFNETGFRNKHKMFGLLDQVINMKIDQMEECGIATEEDIMSVLKTAHKMKMDEMKMEIELIKAQATRVSIGSQNNIQVNNSPGAQDPGYQKLMEVILNPQGRR